MKTLTSYLGWALLLAVLAVPSFLFYNWWSSSKSKASAEISPDQMQTNIFPAADKQAAKPVQPAAQASPAQAPAPAPAQQPPAAQAAAAPAPVPAQPQALAQASVPRPAAQFTATAPVQAVQLSTQTVAVSTGPKAVSWYAPKSDRDPVLSPRDYRRIKEAEMQRLENERQQLLAAKRRNQGTPIESILQLQGIVGNAAIINGEMYSAGQTVRGAKILKVGANYVIGEYKGKKFRKVLQ
ncbi:MAG: hypothetical protein HY952_08600 [Elusimicrobia bacterium]|nr:hypothetical protein [Elusimicrobiota bacterium]